VSQVLSEHPSDSSAFLNAVSLSKYVDNCGQHFSFFDTDYQTSGSTVTRLARIYCTSVEDHQCFTGMNRLQLQS
jgi:hypothetical protein